MVCVYLSVLYSNDQCVYISFLTRYKTEIRAHVKIDINPIIESLRVIDLTGRLTHKNYSTNSTKLMSAFMMLNYKMG